MTTRQRGNDVGDLTRLAGGEIKQEREAQGLTLEEVSRRVSAAGRTLNPSSLSKLERGLRRIDLDDLQAVAAALGVNPAGLIPRGLNSERQAILLELREAQINLLAAEMARDRLREYLEGNLAQEEAARALVERVAAVAESLMEDPLSRTTG